MITTALDITRRQMRTAQLKLASASVASCYDGLSGLPQHVPGSVDLADQVADDGAVIKGTQQLSHTGLLQETTNGVHLANHKLQAWENGEGQGNGNIMSQCGWCHSTAHCAHHAA